jgi:Uracil phosphoribosyltransferase
VELTASSLQAHQALVLQTARLRLNTAGLPVIYLTDPHVTSSVVQRTDATNVQPIYPTDKPGVKLLTTPTRGARVANAALRTAHPRIGHYLATESVAAAIQLEAYSLPHVQDTETPGHRLRNEPRTLIAGLLRGGLPTSDGVATAFPLTWLALVKRPQEVDVELLRGVRCVRLVDAAVSTGAVGGAVRAPAERDGGRLADRGRVRGCAPGGHRGLRVHRAGARAVGGLRVIALRVSDNLFAEKGATDTSNRLFNTTDIG